MAARIAFSEDFLGALGGARQDMDRVLVAFIHVLESGAISEDRKTAFRDRAIAIGNEARDIFSPVKLESVNASNARDLETRLTDRLKSVHAQVLSFISDAEHAGAAAHGGGELFSIKDVADKLGSARINSERALSRDKVENLFAVKNFIIRLYESQTAPREEREAAIEKELLKVKERAFLDAIRGSRSVNPEYFFRSMEIIRKFVKDGKRVRFCGSEEEPGVVDEILFLSRSGAGSGQEIELRYRADGLWISLVAGKSSLGDSVSHSIRGFIEKGEARVEYSLETTIGNAYAAQKERLMGLDYLWSQFDRVYLEARNRFDELISRHEAASKAAVDKAIDDLLF